MGIKLTSKAGDHIKSLMKEHDLKNHVVRVGISREDYSYVLDIVDDVQDSDRTFESEGLRVVVDPRSYLYLASQTEVGFSEADGGFTFSPASVRP